MELALNAIEGVAEGDVDIGMSLAFSASRAQRELLAGNGQIDRHIEWRAVAAMSGRGFDDDVTSGDALVEVLEMVDVVSYSRFNGW